MSSEPEMRASLENIQRRLVESPTDMASLEADSRGLSELGSAVTAAVEAEFSELVATSKPTAA